MYELMRSCWATERVDRPRFTAVVHLLDLLIRSPELLRELAKPRLVLISFNCNFNFKFLIVCVLFIKPIFST